MKQLLEIIKSATISGNAILDFSNRGITVIPQNIVKRIVKLPKLESLNISNNQLTSIPEEFYSITTLKVLDLSDNHLCGISPEIGHLRELTALHLNGNRLRELPKEIGSLHKLEKLYLGRRRSENLLTSLPAEIGSLSRLIHLKIGGNLLSSSAIPTELWQLYRLQELDLGGNQLTNLPPDLGNLSNLVELDLSKNYLTSLPTEIGRLLKLKRLTLGGFEAGNKIKSLPKEMGKLKELTSLSLGGNELTEVPEEIQNLTQLEELDLGGNGFLQMPVSITRFTQLKYLNLSGNQLVELPNEIGNLYSLEKLLLQDNRFVSLPPEIGSLKALTALDLSRCSITKLPQTMGQLNNLQEIDLSDNLLSQLPVEIGQLKQLRRIELNRNRLNLPPPEIVSQGTRAIITFLKNLSNPTIHNEAKLILVGEGDVGKTSLVTRLIDNEFNEDSPPTRGIDIRQWFLPTPNSEKERIRLNVWDFGGQEIYHATHRFFLTERSLYLLVWNARKPKDYEHIDYWLHSIEAYGGDSPTILVMTKKEQNDDDLNMREYKENFPHIITLVKVDSKQGIGISDLENQICSTAWGLPHMRTTWINAWYKVREKLENYGKNYIYYSEFEQICRKEGLDSDEIKILDKYLHDLGVIIHFTHNYLLRNLVILQPEWATKAVYKILNTQSVKIRGGRLFHDELREIWEPKIYPEEIFPHLLELMNTFELAYKLPDGDSHLVTELLPSNEPEFDLNFSGTLSFFYRYDSFLPPGVIPRFIVLVHQNLYKRHDGLPLCWHEGAVLSREKTLAVVTVNKKEKLIEIRISGEQRSELLAIIREKFDYINRDIKKIKIIQEIPCNCSSDCSNRFNYAQLLVARRIGITKVQCQATNWKEVQLSSLLDGYEAPDSDTEVTVSTLDSSVAPNPALQSLRAILSNLYNNEDDARRIVYDSGLDVGNVRFSSKLVTLWHNILVEAHNQNKIKIIVSVTGFEYPHKAEEIRGAYQEYLSSIR